MRAARAAAAKFRIHLSSSRDSSLEAMPRPIPTPATCDAHTCPWWPYSNSKDFKTNAAMILVLLFCALLSGLALNAAIRCFLHRRRRLETQGGGGGGGGGGGETQQQPPPKPSQCGTAAPVALVFSRGMKLAGAEAECTICLSEFVEGEGIRVLGRCNHGFHIQCIHEWLSSHSSCPTCRATCLSSSSNEITACQLASTGAATETQRSPELLLSVL